ncbi:hypothetical protein C5188_08480 [Serratia liquefaciens]|nr:hypothetical protein C5188_08480 [Serratia liquefaciens]
MLTSAWTTKLTLTKSKIASVIENGAHCAPFFCLSFPHFLPSVFRRKKRAQHAEPIGIDRYGYFLIHRTDRCTLERALIRFLRGYRR